MIFNIVIKISNIFSYFRRARTLYPCEADNPSELSFEANVIIFNGNLKIKILNGKL